METIEELIEKFVNLADEYANFIGRKPSEICIYLSYDDKIRVYFTKDGAYSIDFEKIEITEWARTITIPYDYTPKKLKEIYDKAKKYLDEEKERIKQATEKAKEEEIKHLKQRLQELENQIKQQR